MPDEPDPWADLYADLGVDAQSPPGNQPRPSFLGTVPTGDLDALPVEGEADDSGESGEGELDEDGQPKRKRRRRRRGRGRKGEAEGGDDGDAMLPAAGEPIVLEAPAAYDAEGGDFDAPQAAAEAGDEESDSPDAPRDYGVEDATPAATRELIADWNVPSWQEIVAGLYRPER